MSNTNNIKAIDLQWKDLDGHFGKSYVASINGTRSCYAIWICRETGKVFVSDPEGKHSQQNSIDEAKCWCQSHFDNLVRNQVITTKK